MVARDDTMNHSDVTRTMGYADILGGEEVGYGSLNFKQSSPDD